MTDDRLPPEVTPPPPHALKRRMGPIAPVRTRRPWRSFAVVALASLGWGGLAFAVHAVRPDLPWLPLWWLGLVGAGWLLAFLTALALALVPARGQVLPDGRAAERTALVIALGVTAMSALLTRAAPGHSLTPPPGRFLEVALHCLRFELLVGAGVTLVALVAMRRLLPFVSWRLGAAVGAAGASLGGLTLHLLCPFATAAHVTAGHGSGVFVGALAGAALARMLFGRASEAPPIAPT